MSDNKVTDKLAEIGRKELKKDLKNKAIELQDIIFLHNNKNISLKKAEGLLINNNWSVEKAYSVYKSSATSTSQNATTRLRNGKSVEGVVSVEFPEDSLVEKAQSVISEKSLVTPLKLYTYYTYYTKYIDFNDEKDDLILMIWSLGTFCFELFDYFPIIKINAPKSSGKTKVCSYGVKTTRNGVLSQNVSSSWLFRTIQIKKPTLIIDDMEILADKEKGEDINSVLRAGWYRGGMVGRCNKNTLDPEEYSVYCPKIVSNIKGLNDDALETRVIPISLIRSNNNSILNTDLTPLGNDDTELAWAAYCLFVKDNWERIRSVYNSLDEVEGLNGRDRQMWRPLLAIARVIDEVDGSLFDGDCFDELVSVAVKKCKVVEDTDMDSFDMKILRILKDIVQMEKLYTIDDVKQNLDFEANPRSIGFALGRLRLDGGKVRRRDGMFYLLSPEIVNDRWERYTKK